MAMLARRLRSGFPLLNNTLRSNSLYFQRPAAPLTSSSAFSRSYATASGPEEQKKVKVKVPLTLYGGTGNYASALYIAAVRANALEKVETELLDFVEASKRSPNFIQFMKDLTVPEGTRVKIIEGVCAQSKLSDVTKNFLVVVATNGRLKYLESIFKRFQELTMAHRGEVKAIVTTVIPLPPQEEKELKETLQEILNGKTIKLEQKIDPSILGGLMVEFDQKLFDMSIKTRAEQMERFLRQPIDFGSL